MQSSTRCFAGPALRDELSLYHAIPRIPPSAVSRARTASLISSQSVCVGSITTGCRALQAQLARVNLLIVDDLGYVPLSQTGSEILFDVFSRRYENGATIVTSNLPFQEWTTVFASERLTGALLNRITHHVHILEMNGESYRLKQSRSRRRQPSE